MQSFSNDKLAVLGRVHKAEDATQAYNAAVAAGFKRINLDIMFGLPKQSLEEALEDVQLATATGVGHISRYQLTLEPNTLFAAKPPAGLPDEDVLVEMEEEGGAWLRQQGFRPYEVSAWVRDGGGDARQANGVVDSPALHNLNYWQFGDYIGLGAGAHSKITLPPAGGNVSEAGHRVYRARRPRSPDKYISSPHSYSRSSEIIAGSGHLTAGELVYEFMLNALRLVDGFPLALFSDRTGLDAAIIQAEIGRGEELGLLVRDGDRLKPTQRGRQLTDDAILLFSDKA